MSFSLNDDSGYASRIERTMDALRAFIERYESIKRNFSLADTDPVWEQDELLKDLKSAVTLSVEFLTDVIRTPDISCAIVANANPGQIVAVLPLKQLSNNAITCFDKENVGLKSQYSVIAQGGKSFQSMKDPKSTNNYLDQIDVRGIWADKLLALETLTLRKVGVINFDEFHDNALDIADLAAPVREAIEQIVDDEVITNIQLVTEAGQVIEGQIAAQFYNSNLAQNGHRIMQPLSSATRKRFGINDHMLYQDRVVGALKATLKSREQEFDAKSLWNGLEVLRIGGTSQVVDPNYVTVKVGRDQFSAHKDSVSASKAMNAFRATTLLEGVDAKTIATIIADLKAKKPAPAGAPANIKEAYTLPVATLEKLQAGTLQTADYYIETITAMSKPQ